ncbi:MAG: c-type cytochrome [Gammaproteobacteria bacterium]
MTTILSISVGAGAQEVADKAATCAACHGADGNSINPEWPNLAGQHASYTAQQLQLFKDGVRVNASMAPMVANLSPEDMRALGEHFAALSPKIGSISAEDIEAGESLYRGGNAESGVPACMACHGPNGAGNAAAKYPALRGQHAKYTSIQLNAYKNGTRQGDEKGIMATIAEKMTAAEIEAVSKYINALY